MTIKEFTRRYCERDNRIALISYLGTFAAYFLSLWLAIRFAETWYLVAPLVVVNAFCGVRLYIMQHDCGHGSLFETARLNDLAGYGLSTFTLTPYRVMQYNHNMHHTHIGNLEERDSGEIHTMTVKEWEEAPFLTRLGYRLYRNPFLLLPVGGLFTYILRYRWPKNTLKIGAWEVMAQNAVLALWVWLIYLLGGWVGLAVYGATVMVAGIIGVFLVYLQHNFEDTYWDRRPDLSFERAALQGSSALDLGWLWDLGTGNIAYHDIHHFNARIPMYRLRKCHQELRKEFDVQIIRWPEALRSFRLKLWDEDQERLVPFPKAKATSPAIAPAE
ncbi:MAG: fatty acid desaturase [Rhodobacteraceae bacterium]|nr:fatty acid desaturase [Paracoccaceae bacterium]